MSLRQTQPRRGPLEPDVVPFTKVQALGNHFALVWNAEGGDGDWGALALELCPHHFAVGTDGLLVVSPSAEADVRMRYFDPEGLEDMCGNGLRCVAKWAHATGHAPSPMTVQTLAGLRRCEILEGGAVQAGMGAPILETSLLPAIAPVERLLDFALSVNGREYAITGVSFGTTHAVIIGRGRGGPYWAEDSAALEDHPMFPEQTTVDWVEVVSRDHLLMRPWERRLGETLACGTGACASTVAAVLHGLTDRRVRVEMPGGTLLVEWRADGEVVATGAAQIVYEGAYRRLARALQPM